MNEKAVYEQEAPKGSVEMKSLILVMAFIVVLFIVSAYLPFSGIVTLLVLLLGAYLILKVMNTSLFPIRYCLFDDRLSFVRKYGYLEKEAEVFPLNEAEFSRDKIVHLGKVYEFFPNEKLCELLNI